MPLPRVAPRRWLVASRGWRPPQAHEPQGAAARRHAAAAAVRLHSGLRAFSSWSPRVADAGAAAAVHRSVESAAAAALPAAPGQGGGAPELEGAEPGVERLPAASLLAAAEALRALPPGSREASRMRRSLMQSFEEAIPQILQEGKCMATALQLPLSDGAERPLKRLLLQLGRRLRRTGDQGLPAAELPHVPRLLQRIELCDDVLFEDFCLTCSRSWHLLDADELRSLLCNTEDYGLLHATKGPAITRLTNALADGLPQLAEQWSSPAAPSALCRALLALRRRDASLPLLARLRPALEAAAGGAAAAPGPGAEALAALAELHAALGGPLDTLQRTVEELQRGLAQAGSLEAACLTQEQRLGLLGACTRLYWHMPEAVSALFEELAGEEGLAAAGACRHLCAPLRQRLVERLLQGKTATELASGLDAEGTEAWLLLVQDLPASARASGDAARSAAAASLAAALLDHLLGEGGSGVERSALIAAHLAASSVAHCAPPDGTPTPAELAGFAERALDLLEPHWPHLTPRDVQTLFRSPGDCTSLARHALERAGQLRDVRSQVALLHGAAAALPASALQPALAALPAAAGGPAALCAAESALRRGPAAAGEAAGEALAELRDRAFLAALEAPPAWCRRPARGYVQYVQQCLKRSRGELPTSPRAAAQPPPPEQLSAEGAGPVEAAEEPQGSVVPASEGEPSGGSEGVVWHRGMMGWEVRLEVQGRRLLGGYFVPQDATDQEVERARLAAVQHRRSLELHYFRRAPAVDGPRL